MSRAFTLCLFKAHNRFGSDILSWWITSSIQCDCEKPISYHWTIGNIDYNGLNQEKGAIAGRISHRWQAVPHFCHSLIKSSVSARKSSLKLWGMRVTHVVYLYVYLLPFCSSFTTMSSEVNWMQRFTSSRNGWAFRPPDEQAKKVPSIVLRSKSYRNNNFFRARG